MLCFAAWEKRAMGSAQCAQPPADDGRPDRRAESAENSDSEVSVIQSTGTAAGRIGRKHRFRVSGYLR